MTDLDMIREQSRQAAAELCEVAKLKPGDLFVVGCSSSEVNGERIGTATSVETAEAIYEGIMPELERRGVLLAASAVST